MPALCIGNTLTGKIWCFPQIWSPGAPLPLLSIWGSAFSNFVLERQKMYNFYYACAAHKENILARKVSCFPQRSVLGHSPAFTFHIRICFFCVFVQMLKMLHFHHACVVNRKHIDKQDLLFSSDIGARVLPCHYFPDGNLLFAFSCSNH